MRLEVEAIELRAGTFRLGPLSLTAGDGEYLIVLGPTGAGKTLTLEAIAGLRAVNGGRILMDGVDISGAAPEARRVGFLYQDSLLFPHLSVRDNLAYGAHRLPRHERAAAITRLARLLEIEPLLQRMPRGLSGGERQRVALARALATNPVLLLLDEPMASLDPNSRHALRRTLLELHRELGTTTIHVTHNFPEALALGDRVAILIEGKVLQAGPPNEVFASPDSAHIARFLRTATLQGEESELAAGSPTISLMGVRLRAVRAADGEQVPQLIAQDAALENGQASGDTQDLMPGRVISVGADQGALRLRINVGLELEATIAADVPGSESLVEGAGVWVRLPEPSSGVGS